MKTVSAGKKLVDKLIEECTESIDEVKIATMDLFERGNDCKFLCTVYIVLIVIVFTIIIGIGTCFIYYKYINHDKYDYKYASKYDYYVYRASNY